MGQGVLKGSFYMFIGLLISGTLGFVFNVLSARFLGNTGFGILSTAFFLIMTVGSTVGMGLMQMIAKRVAELKEIRKDGKIIIDRSVVSIAVLIAAIAGIITNLYIYNILSDKVCQMTVAAVIVFVLLNLLQGIFQGYGRMDVVASVRVAINVFKLLGLFLFVVILGMGVFGAVSSLFFSFVLTALIFYAYISHRSLWIHSGQIKALLLSFTGIFCARVLISVVLFLPPVLIKVVGGTYDEVARFTAAFTVSKYAIYIFNGFLMALFPNLVSAVQSGDKYMEKKYIKGGLLLTTFFGFCLAIFSFFFGVDLIALLFGHEFALPVIDTFIIFSSVGMFMTSMLINDIHIAKSEYRRLLAAWSISLFGLLFVINTIQNPLQKVEFGILVYSAFSMVLLLVSCLKILDKKTITSQSSSTP